MNLPNKLTIFRMILIAPFLILLLGGHEGWFGSWGKYTDYIALGIFILASLTDLADGKIARSRNLVTNFGKFMDPIADKLLVCSALIALIELDRIPAWIVIVIIGREFIISGFRLIASDRGMVLAASYWGKTKTACQMCMVCLMLLNYRPFQLVTDFLMWCSLFLTLVSLADYLIKNRGVLQE